MKQWILFIFSRSFLRSLVRIAGVWLLVLGGLWFYLKAYSRPSAIQDLPHLKGMQLAEVGTNTEFLGARNPFIWIAFTAEMEFRLK